METSKRKTRDIIAIILFFVVFGGLLLIATFFDLKISDILTSVALDDGMFYTNDIFGATFEIVGEGPIYAMLVVGFSLLFNYGKKNMKAGAGSSVFMGVASICNIAAFSAWGISILGYIEDHLQMSHPEYELDKGAYLYCVAIFIAFIANFLAITAANNIDAETSKKLLKFAWGAIIVAAIPTVIINLGLKSYVGRIRYRAMNMNPDDPNYGFSAFARWYEAKGQWLTKDQMNELFNSTDALKSFPSGHTAAAGSIYSLIMLIDALKINKKSTKILIWVCTIGFTAIVAISRIVVGAHFMSDVLVGGTISFVTMIIVREFLINDRQNLKALFGKKKAE